MVQPKQDDAFKLKVKQCALRGDIDELVRMGFSRAGADYLCSKYFNAMVDRARAIMGY